MNTLAPKCSGRLVGGSRCQRQLDDNDEDRRWLVLLSRNGHMLWFVCPDCEKTNAEWINRELSDEGGCTGTVRLETGSPAEVIGMIRDSR